MSIWISRETSLIFISVEEYEKYLKSKQLYKEGAKKDCGDRGRWQMPQD